MMYAILKINYPYLLIMTLDQLKVQLSWFFFSIKLQLFLETTNRVVGGALASWLVRSSPDRAVRVRALAGDIVLCSWARHFTLTVPFSTQV